MTDINHADPVALHYAAEGELMDAIRQRNVAVGKRLPLAQYDDGLARARARLEAAATMIEAAGQRAPAPFQQGQRFWSADRGRPSDECKAGRYRPPSE